jgi:hypothetical protein
MSGGWGSLQVAPLDDSIAPTLAERFPTGAYSWDSDYGVADGADALVNTQAVTVWNMTIVAASTVQGSITAATDGPMLIGQAVDEPIRDLTRTWVVPVGTLCAVLGISSVLFRRTDKRVAVVADLGWLVMSATAVGLLSFNPAAFIDGTLKLSSTSTRAVVSLFSIGIKSHPTGVGTTPGSTGDVLRDRVRIAQADWWYRSVYEPWCIGELGSVTLDNTTTKDPEWPGLSACERVLVAKSRNHANLSPTQRMLPPAKLGKSKHDEFTFYRDQRLEQTSAAPWINGHVPSERVRISWISLAGIIGTGVPMMILALLMVWWSIAFVLRCVALLCITPFTWLHGSIREKWIQFALRTGLCLVLPVLAGGVFGVSLLLQSVVGRTFSSWMLQTFGCTVVAWGSLVGVWLMRRKTSRTVEAAQGRKGLTSRVIDDAPQLANAVGVSVATGNPVPAIVAGVTTVIPQTVRATQTAVERGRVAIAKFQATDAKTPIGPMPRTPPSTAPLSTLAPPPTTP